MITNESIPMSESENTTVDESGNPLLERQIQRHLSSNLHKLGVGRLTFVAEEFPVAFGRIDILAKNDDGALIVIECKRGIATRDAVGQVQSYMGALMAQNPKQKVFGVIVAQGLDDGAKAAIASNKLVAYCQCDVTISFDFKADFSKSQELSDLLPRVLPSSSRTLGQIEASSDNNAPPLYVPESIHKRRDDDNLAKERKVELKSYLSKEDSAGQPETSFIRYLRSKSAEFTKDRSICRRCKQLAIFAKHSGHVYCTLCGGSQ
jgi:ribosomal protein S27AE